MGNYAEKLDDAKKMLAFGQPITGYTKNDLIVLLHVSEMAHRRQAEDHSRSMSFMRGFMRCWGRIPNE